MKKSVLFFYCICIAFISEAQPKFVGLASNDGALGGGTLIRFVAGEDSILSYYSLPGIGGIGAGDADPNGSVVEASNGKMYGMTYVDGPAKLGTLFEYDYVTNNYLPLVDFVTASGCKAYSSLMQASNGLLYGMTSYGGNDSAGTLFSYAIGSDSIIRLVDMPIGSGYLSRPNSLIQSSNGNLYGMTSLDGTNGGGTIFEFNINTNTYTVKYNLPAKAHPFGDLLELGIDTLYGLSRLDGNNNHGTIFRFVPASADYTVLYNFDSLHGANPQSSLIVAKDGKLYGTTYFGGAHGRGVLFRFDLSSSIFEDIHDFKDTDGFYPNGSPYPASDGNIYGMTYLGGTSNFGTIYQYDIVTSTFVSSASFNYTNGGNPNGHLTEYKTPTGIPEVNPYHFRLYPNPANGLFSIENNYNSTLAVQIINLLGERLKTYTMTGSTQTFDIGDLGAGMYEVRISDGEQVQKVMKVVKD